VGDGEARRRSAGLVLLGYGHDYKKALGDYVRVAGRIPLPPRFAFGAWWSRYWAYSDQEIEEIIRGFREMTHRSTSSSSTWIGTSITSN